MVSIERLLCPVDFSPYSHRALEYAVAMAEYEDDRFEAVVFDRKVRDATMQSSPEGDALPKDLSQLNLRRGAMWAPIL